MPWQYYLDKPLDGKPPGWHNYTPEASAELSSCVSMRDGTPSPARFKVWSGGFRYDVNLLSGLQKNMTTGKLRPIRFVADVCSERPAKRRKTSRSTPPSSPSPPSSPPPPHLPPPPPPPPPASSSNISNGLKLEPLFDGGCGQDWLQRLGNTIRSLPNANQFLGERRDKSILPVRELTFQALKPNAPVDWRVVILGKHPYPRPESATGIALFDAKLDCWESAAFGSTPSMRCLLKAALIAQCGVASNTTVSKLRELLAMYEVAAPPDWFAALLSQGVLLLNAALTVGGGSALTPARHQHFWRPVVREILRHILREKAALPNDDTRRAVLFLWWGADAVRMRRSLRNLFDEAPAGALVEHLEWCNPAAQGDAFCLDTPHLADVNSRLSRAGQRPIDWLPRKDWAAVGNGGSASVARFSEFIQNTQELHLKFLQRLESGLNDFETLEPIRGISDLKEVSFRVACESLGLHGECNEILRNVQRFSWPDALSLDEKAAVYLYTTGYIYATLNRVLRSSNRDAVKKFAPYLSVLLRAHKKLPKQDKGTVLYRGIAQDLSKNYTLGTEVTWWGVSSCSSSRRVASSFSGGATLFFVQTTSAAPISMLSACPGESESILPPGTRLKVVGLKKSRGAGRTEVTLRELVGEPLVS